MFHQEKDVEWAPSEADGAEAEAPEEETTETVGEAPLAMTAWYPSLPILFVG